MQSLPALALTVRDIQRSIAFYTERLGFTRSARSFPADIAEILDFDGDPFLLIGPAAGDPASWLQTIHAMRQPGAVINFYCRDIEQQLAAWQAHGIENVEEKRSGWGERIAIVRDPDEYLVRFTSPPNHTPEQIVVAYERGPLAVNEALAALDVAHVDLTRMEGEWSIRQIVHHISDGHALWACAIKAALANPECQYRHDWYSPENEYAVTLDYAGRDISPALALLQANTQHISQLVHHLPGALERGIHFAWPWEYEPRRLRVEDMLMSQAYHTFAHCEEISFIRQAHGV